MSDTDSPKPTKLIGAIAWQLSDGGNHPNTPLCPYCWSDEGRVCPLQWDIRSADSDVGPYVKLLCYYKDHERPLELFKFGDELDEFMRTMKDQDLFQ